MNSNIKASKSVRISRKRRVCLYVILPPPEISRTSLAKRLNLLEDAELSLLEQNPEKPN